MGYITIINDLDVAHLDWKHFLTMCGQPPSVSTLLTLIFYLDLFYVGRYSQGRLPFSLRALSGAFPCKKKGRNSFICLHVVWRTICFSICSNNSLWRHWRFRLNITVLGEIIGCTANFTMWTCACRSHSRCSPKILRIYALHWPQICRPPLNSGKCTVQSTMFKKNINLRCILYEHISYLLYHI